MKLYEIEEHIKEHIKDNPKSASKILGYVSEALNEYETAVKQEREPKIYNMLSMGLGWHAMKGKKKKESFKISSLIDAMYYLFPKGSFLKSMNSQSDKDMLFDFLSAVMEQNFIKEKGDWIIKFKGQEVYDWLVKIKKEYLINFDKTEV